MLTQVITLISFMEGLCQDTLGWHFVNSLKEFAKSNSFGHHETIRIKDNYDTQASSFRISEISISATCAITLTFFMTRDIHYMNEAMERKMRLS